MAGFLESIPENALNVGLVQTGFCDCVPNGMVHRKVAPCIIVAQTVQGRYEVQCRGRTILAEPGEAFLSATNDPLVITHHGDSRRGGYMRARWLHVHFTLFETIDISTLLTIPMKCNRRYGLLFGRIIKELLDGQSTEKFHALWGVVRRRELVFQALRLLCELSSFKREKLAFLQATQRLMPVFSLIKENLGVGLTVGELAKATHMSLSRFHVFFGYWMQSTPMDYVKAVRLTEASHQLIATEGTIAQIAEAVGFRNQFHFSREFKIRFKMTPTEYRKSHADVLPGSLTTGAEAW